MHLVQKYFLYDCSTNSISCSEPQKSNLMKNTIKTRQQLDRDETALMLATLKQVTSTLRCHLQSTRHVVDLLPPPSLYLIPWTHRLSSDNVSVVVVLVFMFIFLLRRLRRRCRFLGPVVYPLPPLFLSLIPRTCFVSLVLFRRLRFHC